MGKLSLITKTVLPKDTRSMNALLHPLKLSDIVTRMKHKQTWVQGELNAMVLLKSRDKQIVLTALHGGTVIDSFQENNSITFQIIEGKLKFQTRKESVLLDKGQLLTLHENIKYSLSASEETIFLLTIACGVLQPVEN